MRKRMMSWSLRWLWLILVLLFVAAQPPDTKPPRVTITAPTRKAILTTNMEHVRLEGTSQDPAGLVVQVAWSTDRGASGVAVGISKWSAVVPVEVGVTQITVTATDQAGLEGTAMLTVTRVASILPPAASPITVEWRWDSDTGEAFHLERCLQSGSDCPMALLATVAISERLWLDSVVDATSIYCYRIAVETAGTLGDYSNTLCST